MKKPNKYVLFAAGPVISIILSLVIGGLLIALIGQNPIEVYIKLFSETLGNTYGIGQVLFKATPLVLTGLSVAFAFRAGLFNIGAEGQLTIGAFASAWTGFTFVSLPWILLIPLCVIAGFLAGALWAGIAGYLKARFGSHEVINTIMLNFIALAVVSYLVNNVYMVPATIHTPEISPNAVLLRFDLITGLFKGSPFNLSFVIALAACCLMYYMIQKTPFGYRIKTLGYNANAAEYAGMNIKKLTVYAMAIAGGFAGLGGLNFVNGYKHYFELGFSENAGYVGIAVALIARNNPFAIVLVAVFFGILEYGGLTVNTLVPKEIVTILQGIIILLIIMFTKLFDKRIKLTNT
ncbi:MAG TPA: ABC transporter permease [Ignavibacteria bacterium]|nr:ABC transporter permease [Ignavibacteria bacterium]